MAHGNSNLSNRPVSRAGLSLVIILCILMPVLLGAHYLRANQSALAMICLGAPLLLLSRRAWARNVLQLFLIGGGLVWVLTTTQLIQHRQESGLPWMRMAMILTAVSLLTAGSALLLEIRSGKALFHASRDSARVSTAVFVLVAVILGFIQKKVSRPMLLLERFHPSGGWIEVALLSVYGAWVGEKLLDVKRGAAWRRRVWLLFSVVFFTQLALGLKGHTLFMMVPGELHFPVPALILAGPLFRGEGFFMPILLGATLLLVGPGWCSHICYLGSWDAAAAERRRQPALRPGWHARARIALLVGVMGAALALRLVGAGTLLAGGLALTFGLIGVGVMLTASRRSGIMVHCSLFCPVGLVACWLGKLSPFRLRLKDSCDGCARCRLTCRFGALEVEDIERRRPGMSCTLCGDCLASCAGRNIEFRFPGLSPDRARALFITLITTLHAVVMGLART